MTYITAVSRTGYDRRYEDKVFPAGTRCVEMVDYVGGGEQPPDLLGVRYCRAESFYRCFANATFGGPCIVEIGEFPADQVDSRGEAITDQRINMAAAFKGSDIEILPHGCSRHLVSNINNIFDGCRNLRSWTPQQMVQVGLAGVTAADAPAILKSNGIAQHAFLLNLAPETMRRAFANCISYDGKAINAISWSRLKAENSAADFAIGCRFAPESLAGIIASLHREFFVDGTVRTPLANVNLGGGYVTGETAQQAKELIAAGVQLEGFEIG